MSAQVAQNPVEHDEAPTGPAAATGTELHEAPANGTADETADLQERLGGYFNGALTSNLIYLGDRLANELGAWAGRRTCCRRAALSSAVGEP